MTPKLEKACNILRWAIDNRKTIEEGCKVFKLTASALRNYKKSRANDKGYDEFIKLYNKFKGETEEEREQVVSEEELLDKDKVIDSPYLKFIQEQKNKGVLEARGNAHVTTLEGLIAEAKIDLKEWNVDRHVVNKWDVTNAQGQVYENWQVKIWLSKVKTDEEKEQWDYFIKTISEAAPARLQKTIKKSDSRYLFELSLPDLHIGKLAWDKESGEDYDTAIAIDRYNEAVESLINEAGHAQDRIEKILIPIGNDLVNVDSKHNMTTAGTPQNVDSRWQQMFLKTLKLMIGNIDRCSLIAPVEVKMIPGNHDEQTIFYLGESLKAWYRQSDCVVIDNAPNMRKYYSYGVNLIGFTHGNEEKLHDLGMIMATEVPELWAKARYREVHLGHHHKKKEIRWVNQDEYQGFKVKILPSLSGTDSWHYKKGYMSQKGAVGFLYDKERGCVAEYNFNLKGK